MGSAAFRVYDWFYKEHYIEKHFAVKKFAGSRAMRVCRSEGFKLRCRDAMQST
jgi:hypothetical protein